MTIKQQLIAEIQSIDNSIALGNAKHEAYQLVCRKALRT